MVIIAIIDNFNNEHRIFGLSVYLIFIVSAFVILVLFKLQVKIVTGSAYSANLIVSLIKSVYNKVSKILGVHHREVCLFILIHR